MVEPKQRKYLYFAAFILPCLLLYALFFIWPFIHGFYISLTNWDGLTPKSPIILGQEEFEDKILNRIKKESDRQYLLSIYELNPIDKTYSRLSVSGGERKRIERILSSAGYEPQDNRFIGVENYKKILTGQVSENFYPHTYMQVNYNSTSALPALIPEKEFERDILAKVAAKEKETFLGHYTLRNRQYVLKPEYEEFNIEDKIWLIPEADTEKTIPSNAVDKLISAVKSAGLTKDNAVKEKAVNEFIAAYSLSPESITEVQTAADELYQLGSFKLLLSDIWIQKRFNMGVIGFTLFFTFFTVIGINILAFLLALALDTKMKGRTILRSIFFLPNVLSMIIVALIWSMIFFRLMPALTGIDKWLSDPDKTPWLLVLTAVWQGCGYYMIVYLAGLQNIPTDITEASTIDGASSFQRFKFITLPLLLPAFTISLFLSIANALKSFDLVYAMIGSTGYATGTVPFVMDIYFDAFAQKQAGMATAKAMLLFIVIFAVTGLQLFVMKRKEIEQ